MHITHETAICLTHTIPQTEITALLDNWVKNTPSIKMVCPQKKLLLLILS